MRRLFCLLVTTMAVVALSGCGSLGGYAAKVNGVRIDRDEVEDELRAILDNKKYLDRIDQGAPGEPGSGRVRGAGNETFTTTFTAALLDRRISLEIIHQEVVRRTLVPTAEQRKAARRQVTGLLGGKELFEGFSRSYRDKLVRQFSEVFALQQDLGPPTVKAADVARFYEENKAVFDRTCVRHILVDTEEKAAAVKARIAGGEDFAAVAMAESTDRGQEGGDGGSAAQGGTLGCLPAGGLVPEFQQAMDALQPGQVSDPVKTQFGFHVISVTSRQSLTLEEATPEIRQRLQSQASSPVAAFVDEAVRKARIEVNPRYGTFVKSGENPGVHPPKQPKSLVTTPVSAPVPVPER
ncbi:MAG TPA: peptidylprolyl isomerase [Acidimicrobiales bacterium]|nr:peptidylprolyl isomerase [Acidimicrobiales bacterium]